MTWHLGPFSGRLATCFCYFPSITIDKNVELTSGLHCITVVRRCGWNLIAAPSLRTDWLSLLRRVRATEKFYPTHNDDATHLNHLSRFWQISFGVKIYISYFLPLLMHSWTATPTSFRYCIHGERGRKRRMCYCSLIAQETHFALVFDIHI